MDGVPRKMPRKTAGVTAGSWSGPARPGLQPIASHNLRFVRDRVSFRPIDGRREGTARPRCVPLPPRTPADGEAAMTRCGRDTTALRSSDSCEPGRRRIAHSAACSGPGPRTPCLRRRFHSVAPPRLADSRPWPIIHPWPARAANRVDRPHPLHALATSGHNRPLPRPTPAPTPRRPRPRPRDARSGGSGRARLGSCASRSPPPLPRSDGSRPPG